MAQAKDEIGNRSYWFVGSMHGSDGDQTARFVKEGIWENGYEDRYLEAVKSIQPGDKIAIKASYTRKHELPFDNRGISVSVMSIKATGTVKENLGDGRNLKVDWKLEEKPRQWFFFTNRFTVWNILPGNWATDALIRFAFQNEPQDLPQFQNHPYWRDRFGDKTATDIRFQWTRFYQAVADKLLEHRGKRTTLIQMIHEIAGRVGPMSILRDQFKDGSIGPLQDICPFTVFGIFNRGINDTNRKMIAGELARALGVSEAVPETFEGIPVLNNQRTWFFAYEKTRQVGDIDALWDIFEKAIRYADAEDAETHEEFDRAFDTATKVWGVKWNLTSGLYWVRPWSFLSLDSLSRSFISKKLDLPSGIVKEGTVCSAANYLQLVSELSLRFANDSFPVHSFPELSLIAWQQREAKLESEDSSEPQGPIVESVSTINVEYSAADIVSDGCFLSQEQLESILERLRLKKNIILQGPPGTGKTWLAKRLAYALTGCKDDPNVRAVQFHPNLSYEDFVRGWRPSGGGTLSLVDGPFLEMVRTASRQPPSIKHVIVIEEINRGNPAQVFGEMLTLLEADKRRSSEALHLCYSSVNEEPVFIPENLYVIGTMNIADRSLALVDFALRRRFAFIDLDPKFGTMWQGWVSTNFSIEQAILIDIEKRLLELNNNISSDPSLGRQFRIGHSYMTPHIGASIPDAKQWYRQVVETEIFPLLEEYWFDDQQKAHDARKQLIEGF